MTTKIKKHHNCGRTPWNKDKKNPRFSKCDERYKRICELCGEFFFLNQRTGIIWAKKSGRGRFCSDKCSRIYSRGKHRSPNTEFKPGSRGNYNEVSLEVRKKISASLMGISLDEWKGFSSSERLRKIHSKEYILWRKKVFERDDFTCQSCGRRSGRGQQLFIEAHHILRVKDRPDLVCEIENGITLCKDCHLDTLAKKNRIAIVGSEGWVGSAMINLFKEKMQVVPFDIIGIGNKKDVNRCPVCFVCVPTPLKKGKLDISIVEECVKWIESPLIIIRSTVMPGTCDRLEKLGKHIVFQPEYLGETTSHPLTDQKTRPFLVIGGRPENRRKAIELYQTVYNANITIRQVSLLEAEIIKLSENRAIAFKVAQCQELFDACEAAGVDYYTIRDAVYSDDPRFNLWWTFVFPDKRGFNSKCIPKDIYGWAAWAESVGYNPELTRKMLEVNEKLIGS
jgi:hypothetical protein